MEKLLVILTLAVVIISVKAGTDDYYDSKSNEESLEFTYDEFSAYLEKELVSNKEEGNMSTTTERVLTEDLNAVIQTTSTENETRESQNVTLGPILTSTETGITGSQNVTLADILGVLIKQTVTMEIRHIAAELATVYLNPNRVNAAPDTNVPVAEVPKALIQTTSTETGATGSQNLTLGNVMEDLIKRELAMGVRKIAAEIATEYLKRVSPSADVNPSSRNGVYPAVSGDKVSGGTSYPYPYYHERK